MGSGPGNIYEDGTDIASEGGASSDKPAEGSTSKRGGKSASAKGTLEANIERVRDKFKLGEDSYFGKPGNKRWVRVIESDNPARDAKEFFELISSGGKNRNLAEGIDGVRELADGTKINYRLTTRTPGSPAVEISNPGTTLVKKQKIHFVKRGSQ